MNLLSGCSGHVLQDIVDGGNKDTATTPPSQNSALQKVSPSTTASDDHKEHRIMQKNTNEWINGEWKMFTESNTSTAQEQQDNTENRTDGAVQTADDINSSGLQYYVDKAALYLDNKKKHDANMTKTPSHAEQIDAMPGIGKIDRR
ncbi:hypothetical protein [Sulfurimonas sp. HSL3-7]|uniref:hypothetical protein n=1 Tax=Sulfonitrofixus jiaomeiensis TaxID=3131938 RepID=UPI0031F86C75